MSKASAPYRGMREKAWRNLMVAAINAGLEQRLFGLAPGENFWPDAAPEGHDRRGHNFRFDFPDGTPCMASVLGIGFDELRFDVLYRLTPDAGEWIGVIGAGFRGGDAVAGGWLERRDGQWLQRSGGRVSLKCRAGLASIIAGASVEPRDFRDRGRFYL